MLKVQVQVSAASTFVELTRGEFLGVLSEFLDASDAPEKVAVQENI